MRLYLLLLLCGVTLAQYDDSPIPQRAVIPGSIPVSSGRPQFRPRIQGQARALPGSSPPVRLRRPGGGGGGGGGRGGRFQPQALPSTLSIGEPTISRNTPAPSGPTPPLPAILAQARPLPPETPLPPRPIKEDIEDDLPEDIENEPQPLPIPSSTPYPTSLSTRPENLQPAILRSSRPPFRPERPIVSNAADEEIQIPVRQQFRQPEQVVRQQFRQPVEDIVPTRQQLRPQARPTQPAEPQLQRSQQQQYTTRQQQVVRQPPPPPQQQYNKSQRDRKPVAQVISKYREDNPDGSITWGYENDDGSFKEESIGVDCVVRGKYGYTDPDGLRREYTYTSGNPCDKEEEERRKQNKEGFVDYGNNQYVLPNGDAVNLESIVKNRARRPVPVYRN